MHLRVVDVVLAGSVRPRASVTQNRTGRPAVFALTQASREALPGWLNVRPQWNVDWLFPGRGRSGEPKTPRQDASLLDERLDFAGLDRSLFGTHRLRRRALGGPWERLHRSGPINWPSECAAMRCSAPAPQFSARDSAGPSKQHGIRSPRRKKGRFARRSPSFRNQAMSKPVPDMCCENAMPSGSAAWRALSSDHP